MLNLGKKIILDTLFPIRCLACGAEGYWLCPICAGKVKLREFQLCPHCEKEITLSGMLCLRCRDSKVSSLDALITSVDYETAAVKQLIHNFKYRFVRDSAEPLAFFMAKAAICYDLPLPDAIIPVPLHPRRLRWRGFNQSELLARELSQNLAPPIIIPVLDILRRKRYNRPQMEIKNYKERLGNVKNIFSLSDIKTSLIRKKTILLIDDIATTGATLQECAKILKDNGAKKVMAIVVARQAIK